MVTSDQLHSFFCSSLLKINTNRPELVNFKFGGLRNTEAQQQFDESHLTTQYICWLPEEYRNAESVETLSKTIPGLEGACVIKKKSLPFGMNAMMVVDCSDMKHVNLFTNALYEKWSRLRGTCAVQTPEEIAATIGYAQLLGTNALPIHCAAVSKGDKAAVIVAPSNTGKTLSTWRLVTELGYEFVAEDIAIIKEGVIYGCPYTCTDVPDGVRKTRAPIFQRGKRIFFPNQPKACLALHVDQKAIRPSASINCLYFLKRGNQVSINEVERQEAFDILQKNNCLEFKYRSHPLLLELWYRYGYPNVQQMIDKENALLYSFAESVESIIEIVASDPIDFSQIIADHL